MKDFPIKSFWLLVALQLVVLGGIIGQRMLLLKTGHPVMLQCVPIDPRSLLSGDYVILRYKISDLGGLNGNKFNLFQEKFVRNQKVYVALMRKAGARFHEAVAVSGDFARLKKLYPLVIRGTIVSPWALSIRYGLESYFVPQFQGKAIEKEMSNVHVEVAVAENGDSGLRKLFIRGKEVKFR
ncbi:MAG: GDYXXLXY domain-containing protein [Myxococcales bacterium]|nr:GDYXXLXY domain-containing protein [Myxococcales bacterium]MCB9644079.1 GDYXXLXY domain-containing protein [Myxococcales bacterium]